MAEVIGSSPVFYDKKLFDKNITIIKLSSR